MGSAVAICLFTLDRVRTVLLALSLIVMLKLLWLVVGAA
jgi:hypothetical protein